MGANETLLSLANSEKKSLSKKKTYLSLSKLSAAFSGAEKEVVEKKIDGECDDNFSHYYGQPPRWRS